MTAAFATGRDLLKGTAILVVEHDPKTALTLALPLAREGAAVRVTENADQALALLRSSSVDGAVVNLVLPGMSGLVLARELRRSDPGLVVIAVSTLTTPDVDRLAIASGCAAIIPLPVDELFVETVAQLLRKRS